MKTKKILGTLALAALAAACSNEEFEAVNNSPALNGRVELGQISLTVGDAETRWTVGEGSNFNNLYAEEGDEVGACLIDVYDGTPDADEPKTDYQLVNYIQTNYSFKKGSGTNWVSEAKMVEGNYVFYAPYNANHATRTSLTVKYNPVQQLTKAADGSIDAVSAIKQLKESGQIMAVSHKFISRADSKSVKTNLLPIYAYPLVTLTNAYKEAPSAGADPVATDLVINQVVVTKKNGTFTTEGTLKFTAQAARTAIAEVNASGAKSVVAKLGTFSWYDASEEETYAVDGESSWKNGSKANYTSDLVTFDGTKTSAAIVVKAPDNAWTLKAGASTSFHVVIPAADYSDTNDKLIIHVYTNKGVFALGGTSGFVGTIAAGKRYAKSEYNTNGSLKQPAEAGDKKPGDVFTAKMQERAEGSIATIVASTADLVTLINNTAAGESGTPTTLNVKPLSTAVEVNEDVVDAFKAKDNTSFVLTFEAPVTISASISSNKVMNFNDGAIINSGTIALGSKVKINTASKELVVNGGTVTVGATFTNATLVVKGGAVTLNTNVDATVAGGKLTLSKTDYAKTITVSKADESESAEVTFTNGDSSKNTWKSYSSTTVINTKGTVTIPSNAILYSLTNSSVANNNGIIYTGSNNAGATINNSGRIAGSFTSGETTTTYSFANNGTIDMKDANAKVTVSTGNGLIKNNVDATAITTTGSTNSIYYEFNSDVNGKLVPKCSNYTMIYLNGMTWNPEASQVIGATIKMTDATIAIYDQETKIGVKGKVIVANSRNGKSYLKGNSEAYFWAANEGTEPTGLTITGPGNRKWDWNGEGEVGVEPAPAPAPAE